MPTSHWGARVIPPPPAIPGFANALGLNGPLPNETVAAAWTEFWLGLDRGVADVIRAILHLPATGDTISYWAAEAARRGEPWGVALCGFLDGIDPGHCGRALRRDGTA